MALVGISTIITVYVGGMKVIQGEIGYGVIAEFILYVNMLTWPVASLGWVTSIVQRAEVSQRRTNVSRRRYNTDHHGLAAPYFPRVIDPADAAVGDVLAAIVEQQRGVLLEYKTAERWGVATFVVPAKTETVPIRYDDGSPAQFVAFARANGLRMNLREAQKMIGLGLQLRALMGVKNGTRIESVLTGKTEQELTSAAAQWVMAQLPDVIMTEQQARPLFLPNEVAALQSAIAGLMMSKIADVQNALVTAKAPAKPAEPEVKPGDEWIGIAGNHLFGHSRLPNTCRIHSTDVQTN
jgi:hypothetical protein